MSNTINYIYFKPARQIENTGDVLINKALLDLLVNYGLVILDDTKKPEWFIKEIISRNNKVKLLSEYKRSLLWSLLFDRARKKYYKCYPPGHISKRGIKNALGTLIEIAQMSALKVLGCNIITVGFTSGPFDQVNAKLEVVRSNLHNYYGVRDYQSLNSGKALGFGNVDYFPDIAWSYRPGISEQPADGKDVILSFRSNSYGTEHQEAYLRPIINSLIILLRTNGFVDKRIKICFQVKYDREASIRIYEELRRENFSVSLIDRKLSLTEADELYSHSSYVISNRLHVLLLALQNGALAIPYINVADNRKIASIYTDNGLGKLILDSDEDVKTNVRRLQGIFERRTVFLKEFIECSEKNTILINEKLSKAFGMITNRGMGIND